MESHPVPQHISSYEFHLVGDMTLKQFIQVAAGALIGLLIYSTSLPGLIKWPLILVFFLIGLALAFLPIEERPLEQWILAFIKAIYSPTQYIWHPGVVEKIFQEEVVPPTPPEAQVIIPKGEAALEEYLKSIPQTDLAPSPSLEKSESSFLERITSLFSSFQKPAEEVGAPVYGSLTIETPAEGEAEKAQLPESPDKGVPNGTPPNQPVQIPRQEKPAPEQQSALLRPFDSTQGFEGQAISHLVGPIFSPKKQALSKKAEFSPTAAPPNPPTLANVAVGQVLDQEDKIIEGAVLEIRDDLGRPVRAVKSNKLGHFAIVTPLYEGKYQIITEKPGFEFDSASFEAKGEIIPPILIKATRSFPVEPPDPLQKADQYF